MKYFLYLIFIFPLISVSQEEDLSYNLDYRNSEKVIELCTNFRANSFLSNAEADAALAKILSVVGASKRFIIAPCDNINNALATIDDGIRYILYDPVFMNSISDKSNYWANMSILAHEVGHHINGHTLGGSLSAYENKLQELESDQFSGFIMGKLGATLEQAIEAISAISSEGDDTYSSHPNRDRRVRAITKGFENSSNNQYSSNSDDSNEEKDFFYLAYDLAEVDDYEGAIANYTKDIEQEPSAAAYHNRGLAKENISDRSGAIMDFNRSIEINPEYSSGLYQLGRLLILNEDYYGALSAFEKYSEFTDWENSYKDLYTEYFSAKALYNKDFNDSALDKIDWIIKNKQGSLNKELLTTEIASFYELRGNIHMDNDSLNLSLEDYIKAAELDPDEALYPELIGDAYVGLENYRKAIEYYNKSTELDNSRPSVYRYRAIAYADNGQYFDALFDITEAIKLNPNSLYYYERGNYNLKLNKKSEACKDWVMAQKLWSEKSGYTSFANDELIEHCGYQKTDFYSALEFYDLAVESKDNADYSKAIDLFEISKRMYNEKELFNDVDNINGWIAYSYIDMGNYAKALEVLNKIGDGRETVYLSENWFSKALWRVNEGLENFEEVINLVEDYLISNGLNQGMQQDEFPKDFVSNNQDDIEEAFTSYQSSLVALNDYEKSLNVLDYLIEVSEIMEYDNWLDYAYFKKAETKLFLKDYLGAIQDISESIKKYPKDWMNWDLRAKIKLEYTAIGSACEDYKEALRLIELNDADNSEDIDLIKKIIKDNCN